MTWFGVEVLQDRLHVWWYVESDGVPFTCELPCLQATRVGNHTQGS